MLGIALRSAEHHTTGEPIWLVEKHRTSQEEKSRIEFEKRPTGYVILAEVGTQTLKVGDHFFARFDQGLKSEEIRMQSGAISKISVYGEHADLSQAEKSLEGYCGKSDPVEVA